MTSPLPRTPGDRREDHAQAVADTVAAIYAQVELVLIATTAALARKVALGAMPAAIAQRRLTRAADDAFHAAAPRIRAALGDGLAGVRTGTLGSGATAHVPGTDLVPLAQSLDTAAVTAASAARETLTAATTSSSATAEATAGRLPTPHQAAVGRAIDQTRGGMPGTSLSLSRIQAAQKALDDLGEQGITGFVDRSGRRWNLTSYVEMATRTAVSTAWDDMQAAAAARSGLDLAEVSTHSTEGSCPRCRRWLGRTLSLTGATKGYPTLAEAKASGFRHPSCRCFWAVMGAGAAEEVTSPVALEHAAAVYKASQRQRALERNVRAAGRRAHAAITPQARSQARRELAAAQVASNAHRQRTGLRMSKVGVTRREHPTRAH